jgi:riboflavin kinase/FMN adenylyltransferase
VPAVRCDELPTHPVISSSSIRQALLDGRVSDANAMLGRPYRLVGTTVAGDKRGARLGFPTANLDDIWHLIPQHAVYAAVAQLDDGRLHLAAVNVGPQPTFDQMQARVEAHLLDFEGELHGRRLGLHFLARLREQSRFGSVEELVACVRADVARVREFAPELATLRDSELLGL